MVSGSDQKKLVLHSLQSVEMLPLILQQLVRIPVMWPSAQMLFAQHHQFELLNGSLKWGGGRVTIFSCCTILANLTWPFFLYLKAWCPSDQGKCWATSLYFYLCILLQSNQCGFNGSCSYMMSCMCVPYAPLYNFQLLVKSHLCIVLQCNSQFFMLNYKLQLAGILLQFFMYPYCCRCQFEIV